MKLSSADPILTFPVRYHYWRIRGGGGGFRAIAMGGGFGKNKTEIRCSHPGGTHGGPRGPYPLGPEKTIFSGFLALNYVISIFEVFFLKFFFLCGRTEEACRMIKSLCKVDSSHPTGHYILKNSRPPLTKSWVRPCSHLELSLRAASGHRLPSPKLKKR